MRFVSEKCVKSGRERQTDKIRSNGHEMDTKSVIGVDRDAEKVKRNISQS